MSKSADTKQAHHDAQIAQWASRMHHAGNAWVAASEGGFDKAAAAATVGRLIEEGERLMKAEPVAAVERDGFWAQFYAECCEAMGLDQDLPDAARKGFKPEMIADLKQQLEAAKDECGGRANQVDYYQQSIDNVTVACGSLGLMESELPAHIKLLRERAEKAEPAPEPSHEPSHEPDDGPLARWVDEYDNVNNAGFWDQSQDAIAELCRRELARRSP